MFARANILRRSLLGLCLSIAAPPAWGDIKSVERTFLERSAISAADQSCNLFNAGERLALKSGLYQAEGELLRANYDKHEIDSLAREVGAHARSLGCDHPNVAEVAATIRSSYRQFAKTTWLEYPSQHGVWGASRSPHDAWAVSQTDAATGAMYGLRRTRGSTDMRFAIAIPATGPMPIKAQIFHRDANRLREPWFGTALGRTVQLKPPPRSLSRSEWASERALEQSVTGEPLQVFYFPMSVLSRLETLDPREAVAIEITPSPRAKDQTPFGLVFEIGDFRAARAFAMMPQPQYAAQASASGR